MDDLAVGKIKIKATKTRDKNGREGFFITKEDWRTVRAVIVTKGAHAKSKKSLMPGIKQAFKEIKADLHGTKPLPDASEPIKGL